MRHTYIRTCIKQFTKEVRSRLALQGSAFPAWCRSKGLHGVPVTDTVPCPPTSRVRYRNKCEFTLGLDKAGKPLAGFVSAVQNEEPVVGSASGMLHVPYAMAELCHRVTTVLRTPEISLPVYSRKHHTGVLRLLVIRRSTSHPGIMIVLQIFKDERDSEKQQEIWRSVKDVFLKNVIFEETGDDSTVSQRRQYDGESVISFYIQERAASSDAFEGDPPKHAWGDTCIVQELMGLNFCLGPTAFFQTNVEACNTLYATAFEYIGFHNNALLDICCGIGTIGLCYIASCQRRCEGGELPKVVGIEMAAEAVESAQQNAEKNGLGEYTTFMCGRAEDLVEKALGDVQTCLGPNGSKTIPAIVDPPRAGLHSHVVETLRNCKWIDCLVYISCNPDSFVKDAAILCTPIEGCKDVFVPIQVKVVDMFPHTFHCEIVVKFVRYSSLTDSEKSEIQSNVAVPKENVAATLNIQPDDVIYAENVSM